MIKNLYLKYFAPDRMLRHIFQHIEIAAIGLLIYYFITKVEISGLVVLVFLGFSFLPDLDGISSVFIWAWKIPMAKETVRLLMQFKIKEALSYATVHHKQLNRLTFHNVVAYTIFWLIFISSVKSRNYGLSLPIAALLSHFTFDLSDDWYQMGHIKNWLWPLHLLFPQNSIFKPTEQSRKPGKEYISKKIRDLLLIS